MTPQANNQCKRVIVLDTSAFVAGFDPFSLSVEQVTVPKVEEEIKRNSMNKLRFETALENGKVKVKAPSQEFINQIRLSSSKVGDSFKLSETDIELLALALELKSTGYSPQVVSDDYSIQNVASKLEIEFSALSHFWYQTGFRVGKVLPGLLPRISRQHESEGMQSLRHRS